MYLLFSTFAEDICSECDVHAICVRGKCRCRAGYMGDGYECIKGEIYNASIKYI